MFYIESEKYNALGHDKQAGIFWIKKYDFIKWKGNRFFIGQTATGSSARAELHVPKKRLVKKYLYI